MDWIASNLIALVALAISIWTAYRSRHRVLVSGRPSSAAWMENGQLVTHQLFTVGIVNHGKPTNVREIEFRSIETSGAGAAISWHTVGAPYAQLLGRQSDDTLSLLQSAGLRLEDGASASVSVELAPEPGQSNAYGAVQFHVLVRVSGRKKPYRGGPYWYLPGADPTTTLDPATPAA